MGHGFLGDLVSFSKSGLTFCRAVFPACDVRWSDIVPRIAWHAVDSGSSYSLALLVVDDVGGVELHAWCRRIRIIFCSPLPS